MRGGGQMVKLSREERAEVKFAAKAVLDPEVEKNLRRNWKRKPKEMLVSLAVVVQ